MYYLDNNIDMNKDKMYHIEIASAIIYLLSKRDELKALSSFYNKELEQDYLNYFSEKLKDVSDDYNYVSFDDILSAISSYEGSELYFTNLSENTEITTNEIYLISYLLLINGHPTNITEKYYMFEIEKSEKCWGKCKKHFNSLFFDKSDIFPLKEVMFLIMLCILPHERKINFTQNFIADVSATFMDCGENIEDVDLDNIDMEDSSRTTVKSNIHIFLEKLGHTIINFKKGKSYKFPLDVTVILVTYFSFNGGEVYRNIMNNKKDIITDEEKTKLISYGVKIMGKFIRHYFCYNEKIYSFPYKFISNKVCTESCYSKNHDDYNSYEEGCFYYNLYSYYWNSNLEFDKKISSLENIIENEFSDQLNNITSKLKCNDPYFGFLKLTPDFFIDFEGHDTNVDLERTPQDDCSNITYYERLCILKNLHSEIINTLDIWQKKIDYLQKWKEDTDFDYRNFYKCSK